MQIVADPTIVLGTLFPELNKGFIGQKNEFMRFLMISSFEMMIIFRRRRGVSDCHFRK
jgi:hypothetical protein